jgi:hypothetical protein
LEEAPDLVLAIATYCSWLHFDSASSSQQTQKEKTLIYA